MRCRTRSDRKVREETVRRSSGPGCISRGRAYVRKKAAKIGAAARSVGDAVVPLVQYSENKAEEEAQAAPKADTDEKKSDNAVISTFAPLR